MIEKSLYPMPTYIGAVPLMEEHAMSGTMVESGKGIVKYAVNKEWLFRMIPIPPSGEKPIIDNDNEVIVFVRIADIKCYWE